MIPIIETKVLNHGLVALTSYHGSDEKPAVIARNSYGKGAVNPKTEEPYTEAENAKLVDYLITNRHTTPLEFCQVEFYMVMPIFVARQWVRHRTASINEESLRYVEARNQFYIPALDRCQRQSKTNKQGSGSDLIDDPAAAIALMETNTECAYECYQQLLKLGMAKELARTQLPLSTYTAWHWTANLHNTLHLLKLRLNPHAQYEIRVYAEAMLSQLETVFPLTINTWKRKVLRTKTVPIDEVQ